MNINDIIRSILHAEILNRSSFSYRMNKYNGNMIKYAEKDEYLNQAPKLIIDELKKKPVVGIVRKEINNQEYVNKKASWLRYERFLVSNEIPFKFYDIYQSNWIEEAKDYDIIVWHTSSNPSDQYIAESKIYILEKVLHKTCFPTFHEVWQYEDKNRSNYLYKSLNIPCIPTIVTNNKDEALKISDSYEYPFISKVNIGASSSGVLKINSKKKAVKIINKIFGSGLTTTFPYYKQKDNFYWQKFIPDANFDLRIMIVGNKAFGYYRYPKKNDFRASGSGIVDKKSIPVEAIRLAIDVKNKLNSRLMGVDMLYSEKNQKYLIIETSLFNQIDTPEQLVVDGIPGYYDISSDNLIFKEGRFWIQELLLELIVKEWQSKNAYI